MCDGIPGKITKVALQVLLLAPNVSHIHMWPSLVRMTRTKTYAEAIRLLNTCQSNSATYAHPLSLGLLEVDDSGSRLSGSLGGG